MRRGCDEKRGGLLALESMAWRDIVALALFDVWDLQPTHHKIRCGVVDGAVTVVVKYRLIRSELCHW